MDRVRQEQAASENIRDRVTRKNVQAALATVLTLLRAHAPNEDGLAIFAGETRSGYVNTCLPYSPVGGVVYRCGNAFHVQPLLDALRPTRRFGLLVLDRREATLGFLENDRVRPLRVLESTVQGKHGQGGQSQHRFERIIQNQAEAWFEKVCRAANEVFLETGVEALFVGIPGLIGEEHLRHLHHELRKHLSVHGVSYTDEAGLRELVQAAQAELRQQGALREEALWDELLRAVASGRAAYGAADVEAALRAGQARVLLLAAENPNLATLAADHGAEVEVLRGEAGKCLGSTFTVAVLLRW